MNVAALAPALPGFVAGGLFVDGVVGDGATGLEQKLEAARSI